MGQYTVTTYRIDVIGRGWYGQKMTYTYPLSSYDRENIEELTRDGVLGWLGSHAGDFMVIDDFRVDWGKDGVIIDWEKEESEYDFVDMMYPVD